MKRHVVVGIVALFVIGVTVSFSLVNAVFLDNLQIRWHNEAGGFDYLTLVAGEQKVRLCNTAPVPLFVNQVTIAPFYDKEELGRFVIDGTVIPASASVDLFGTPVNTDSSTDIMMMYLDTEFSGNDIARIDGSKMTVLTQVDTKILGLIPYSSTQVYPGDYFLDMMNYRDGSFAC